MENCFVKMVTDFREAFDLPYPKLDTTVEVNGIIEEFNEFVNAVRHEDSEEDIAKEVTDLLYVTLQFMLARGIDIEKAFSIVHESNMSKLNEYGTYTKSTEGKVLKPPHYVAPDMRSSLLHLDSVS